MKILQFTSSLWQCITERSTPFLLKNGKIIVQLIFTAFFIGVGIWFIKDAEEEIAEVQSVMRSANWQWILAGFALTVIYIFLQGLMYVASFASVKSRISLMEAITLFLKRNFISVFLPAGGISSLAFFSGAIEKKGLKATQIHFASSVYGFVGILSVVIVAIPAFIYALLKGTIGSGEWYALAAILLLTIALLLMYRSILKKGVVFRWLTKMFPSTVIFMDDLGNNKIDKNKFLVCIIYSILIEFTGIAHLYISMLALNVTPIFFPALLGYIISVIFLIVSPFLRGLGAIEVSMTYVLIRFGFGNVEAISITLLYRLFEFWLPLISGAITFLLRINKLLLRILPAFFLLVLGIINIISAITPAIGERLNIVKQYLAVETIHASNYLVLMVGLFLLVTAAFMLKGLRTAWWFALTLSIVSFFGNLTKAIDYEEAVVALIVILILLATRKEYYIKNNPKLRLVGLQTALLSIAAVLLYGTIGFYFLDKKHFNIDFSLVQSIGYTFKNYILTGSPDLIPADALARYFLISIKVSGVLSLGFLIYTLVIPYIPSNNVTEEERFLANELLNKYGNDALDYFKVYRDKLLFFSKSSKAFCSYRVSENFAVVLSDPVAESEEERKACIKEFDFYCYQSGLKSLYYRVPESSLPIYQSLGKKSLFLGQEGVVDLATFNLEGRSKKSIRNALKKINEKGWVANTYVPPINEELLRKIKIVSDEWLADTERKEMVFSQGMFVWEELKQQTIITVSNTEEKIVAFLNIIPDFVKGEGTYDLIRKSKDAPNGTLDFITVELFNYLKSRNFTAVNLGFTPMSGLEDPHTFPEKSMNFAYKKIKSFSHYKGLRDFKEKFDPNWRNQYLIYTHDYDLLQVPLVLTKVIRS